MEESERPGIKGTVWVWTIIGAIAGWFLFGFIAGMIAGMVSLPSALCYVIGIVGAIVVGRWAYRGSAQNSGKAPTWLWRSKK